MRIPMNGESVWSLIPIATCFAAKTAVSSSSLSERLPKPSSKSILKSSTPSVSNFAITF